MEFKLLPTSLISAEEDCALQLSNLKLPSGEDEPRHAKASKQKLIAEEVCHSELPGYLASDVSEDDGDDSKTNTVVSFNFGSEDFHSRKTDECSSDRDALCCSDVFPEGTDHEQKVSKAEPEAGINSNTMLDLQSRKRDYFKEWSDDECGTNLDDPYWDLFLQETDNEREVSKAKPEMDINPDTVLGFCFRNINYYMSENECSCDRDSLYCDDLFPEETDDEQEVSKEESEMDKNSDTMLDFHEFSNNRDDLCCDENKHEVLADDQEATTILKGYDIQCSKTKREKAKAEAPCDEKLPVGFTVHQSDNLLKSPLFASNLKDPLYEGSAADVHQAGSQKQNGVQNTLLSGVNVTTDGHFSSVTSDASFQTVPKYQFKEENLPQIGQETHRLAILSSNLRQVGAAELFGGMCYFLPTGGQIKSVAIHMKEDGPVGLFDDKVDELHKLQTRPSEESRRRYYGIVECDSTDTAKFVYKDFMNMFSYIGVTPKMLELRFIPDLTEFDDRLHDIVTEEPTAYGGLKLVRLLSAKDLEQIVIVPENRSAPRYPLGCLSRMWAD